VSLLGLAVIGLGIALMVIGAWRAWGPYARVRSLDAETANLRRYEAWRGGGRRAPGDEAPTAAELMRAELLRQARWWAAVAAFGVVLVAVGVILRP